MAESVNRATAAVGRALDDKQREATEEVERILSAAVRVSERMAPDSPRVSDIVAEANSSNKAFYRYFAGKDDLMMAVMERGVAQVVSYLQHQMDKAEDPAEKIARWVEGSLAPVADPHLTSMSRATVAQMSVTAGRRVVDSEMMAPMRDLLIEPCAALGLSAQDIDTVFLCATGTMRRYFGAGREPGPDDIAHLVNFCLKGIGAR